MRQKQIALLTESSVSEILGFLKQPTGEFATVNDDDGNEITVEVIYGGYNNWTQTQDWNIYLLATTDQGLVDIVNYPDYIRLANLTNDGDDNFSFTDGEIGIDVQNDVAEWALDQDYDPMEATSLYDLVNEIGDILQPGFDLDSQSF